VLRIAEVGLSIAIWIAVLAFGGTSPPFFLVTEVIILGLGVFFLSASLRAPLTDIRLPLAAPVALIALVVAQILPLPAFLAPLYASLHIALAEILAIRSALLRTRPFPTFCCWSPS